MSNPKVSILIPAYNVEGYIRQCLESIAAQTYSNLQVVIVDDGSSDSTGAICDDFASRHPFAEVYHIPNSGVANARNLLLSKIKGDYTLFVDADDWIEPDMIERMAEVIQQYSADIAVCRHIVERDGSASVINTNEEEKKPVLWSRNESIAKFLRHEEINGSLWNKLIKSSLFEGIRFNPAIWYGEDALVVWQILQRINRIAISDLSLYHYRMNADSISHQSFGEKKKTGHLVWETIYNDTCRMYPELAQFAGGCYAVSDFWLLYYASLDNYTQDKDIRLFRQNIRRNLRVMRKHRLLTLPRLAGAYAYSFSYSLTTLLVRFLRTIR